MKRKKLLIASAIIVVCLAIIATALVLGSNKNSFHSIKRMLFSDDEMGYSYRVNYLEKETHMTILPSKEDDTPMKGDVIQAEDEIVDIYGFEYDSADVDSIEIDEDPSENIINLYYTRNESSVIVHHCVVGDNTKLVDDEEILGFVGDSYEVEPKEELEVLYNCVNNPIDRKGYFADDTIEVTFLYEAKEGTVKVSYLYEEDEGIIADADYISGSVNSPYKVTPKEIVGYECVDSEGDTTGFIAPGVTEVKFMYRPKVSIEINYLDKDEYDEALAEHPELYTNGELPIASVLAETTVVTGIEGETYTCMPKDIEGYDVVERPNPETVTFSNSLVSVNYFYEEKTTGLLEKHVDIVNGTILDSSYSAGNVGDPYTINSKAFDGYALASNQQYVDITGNTLPGSVTNMTADYIPENYSDNLSSGLTEVVYYYIRPATIHVKYVDLYSGVELKEDATILNMNPDGTFTSDGTIDASYDEAKFEGDAYSTNLKDIGMYTPAKNKEVYSEIEMDSKGLDPDDDYIPENANGTVRISNDGNNEETITYYYTTRAFGTTVEYKDIYTEEVIKDFLIQGNAGEPYGTNFMEETEGLRPVTNEEYYRIKGLSMPISMDPDAYYVPENQTGNMPMNNRIVTYYYVRPIRVIAEYIDIETKEDIPAYLEENWYENGFNRPDLGDGFPSRVVIDGIEGDTYTTSPKRFENYEDVVIDPINATGVMRAVLNPDGTYSTEIHVQYIYARYSGDVYVVHFDIENDSIIQEEYLYGGVGTPYVVSPLDDEDYVLAKNSDIYTAEELSELGLNPNDDFHPTNERGLFKTEQQNVIFYYKAAPEENVGTGKVYVKYVDVDDPDNTLYTLESRGNIGDEYVTEALEFDGYELIKNKDFYTEDEMESLGLDPDDDYIPENYRVTYLNGEQEIVYYYKKVAENEDPGNQSDPTDPNGQTDPTDPNGQSDPTDPNGQTDPTDPNGQDSSSNSNETTENITNNYYTTNNYYNTTNNYYNTTNNYSTTVLPAAGTTVVVDTTDTGSGTSSGSKVTVTDGDTTSKGGETVSTSASKTPSTGDTLPVIAIGVMAIVVLANIIASFMKKDKKDE